MADSSQTQLTPFNCEGGLVLNRSTFLMKPGEALVLENFERVNNNIEQEHSRNSASGIAQASSLQLGQ